MSDEPDKPDGNPAPIIRGVRINEQTCLAHECCVLAYPAVFVLRGTTATLTDDARNHFQTAAQQILTAAAACPVQAIDVETDAPTEAKSIARQSPHAQGLTVLQLLELARKDKGRKRSP
ncbi:MAG TPA: ferredoxin [Planctomycetaceae bacterium]|jgi:ferredoxin|nr:ferredoxin [Planctomycetaceae bacterium]